MWTRRVFLASSAAVGVGAAASAQDGFEQFSAFDPNAASGPDLGPFEEFQTAFCIEDGGRVQIAYERIEEAGRAFLAGYIDYFADLDPTTFSKDSQLSYWLTLQNLLVIAAVTEQRRRGNLSQARGDGSAPGSAWTEIRVRVNDVALSLDDLERRVVLAHWSNPDVIYGLYQGVKGGPALTRAPWRADAVDARLAEQGRAFVRSRAGARIGRRGRARLSAIYQWYTPAVFRDEAAVRDHVAGHLDEADRTRFAAADDIEYLRMAYAADEFVVRRQDFSSPSVSNRGGSGS